MAETKELVCSKHGLTTFVYRKSDKRFRCRKCTAEMVQRKRYILKQKCIDYKGGKCEKCGYNKCNEALEFHHLNPETKLFDISSNCYNHKWSDVEKELDKCIMLCANCHRELHSEMNIEQKEKIFIKNKFRLYNEETSKQIVNMKDNEGKSFYTIARELKIARNTVMSRYHKYKDKK